MERRDTPPADSILYERGNCILLSIFRLAGDADLLGSITDAAGSSPLSARKVRTYMECITLLGEGSLRCVDICDIRPGSRYLVHADGMGDEPHCVSMCISPSEIAIVSDLDSPYLHSLSDIRDYLSSAIDKPIVFEYTQDYDMSSTSSQAHIQGGINSLLHLSAGRW